MECVEVNDAGVCQEAKPYPAGKNCMYGMNGKDHTCEKGEQNAPHIRISYPHIARQPQPQYQRQTQSQRRAAPCGGRSGGTPER